MDKVATGRLFWIPRNMGTSSQPLIIIGLHIFHDILHAAFEDDAEIVDRGCIQRLVLAEFVDGGAGDVVIFDERIGGLRRLLQRSPEPIIYDHHPTPLALFGEYIVFYGRVLDYSRNNDYNVCKYEVPYSGEIISPAEGIQDGGECMNACHNLALELESLVRWKMNWPQNLRGTPYSADSIEFGTFVEVLEFLLRELKGDPRALEGFFVNVAANRGKPMEEIGYDTCQEYLEQTKVFLDIV